MSKQNSFRHSERRKRDTLLEKFAEPAENVGVRVEYFEEKGRGVVADKDFKKGDYVIEYVGDLIDVGRVLYVVLNTKFYPFPPSFSPS
jgi:histone-lysine N-methyltransferase SETD8